MHIRPVKNNILVKLAKVEEVTNSGIILSKSATTRPQHAEIISKGSTVSDEFSVGMKVQIDHGKFRIVTHPAFPKDDEFAFISDEDIVGIWDE